MGATLLLLLEGVLSVTRLSDICLGAGLEKSKLLFACIGFFLTTFASEKSLIKTFSFYIIPKLESEKLPNGRSVKYLPM